MSSVENLRQFVIDKLTSTVEEIFGVFEKTLTEYEKEIERQRLLLDIVWKPDVKVPVIEQQEVLSNQERIDSVTQKEPETPQIKEEQEELCMVLTERPHGNKARISSLDLKDPEPPQIEVKLCSGLEEQFLPERENDGVNSNSIQSDCEVSPLFKNDDQREAEKAATETAKETQPLSKKRPHTCNVCGKMLPYKSRLIVHMRLHTGDSPYTCNTCGKKFPYKSYLTVHMRTHTGEKPHSCCTCGKRFSQVGHLNVHRRIHSKENPRF